MNKQEERKEQKRFKADTRNLIDVTLLGICITLFGLVATLNPDMLSNNPIFTLQLVSAIPFFMCGLLARVKEAAYSSSYRWEILSIVSFTLAYGFFINFIGLILSFITPLFIALVFFGVNTLLTLIRATIVVSYNPSKFKSRLARELIHIAIIVFLGVLPALKIY